MSTDLNQADELARLILAGFHSHFSRFQLLTQGAAERFLAQRWQDVIGAAAERISYYDKQVALTSDELLQYQTQFDEALWLSVRQRYQSLLQFHPQADLAETFYNSVFCSAFERQYFHNAFIFVESTLEERTPVPIEHVYQSYFPVYQGFTQTLEQLFLDLGLGDTFENLKHDVEQLRATFLQRAIEDEVEPHEVRIDVLKTPFYRNKAAYVVGRIVTQQHSYPFIVPILINPEGRLYVDAFITQSDRMAAIFGFARSYFMVRTEAPSALVRFLKQLMPRKTFSELYSSIGFHKQAKTEFYRDFLRQLANSNEQLSAAPGVKGMVMTVFTLPSFPYVFKVIKDELGDTKGFGRSTVVERYRMVKQHDRVGRMADTLEFSDVAIPKHRIADDLMDELLATVGSSIRFEGDLLVISQCFVERRMIPLNMYLEYASEAEQAAAIDDYGRAIKDMIAANIFPGDMLLKNFGVTRHKRVVFYDYDEVRYLTDMNFKSLAKADHEVSFAPDDVFPEQLAIFAVPQPRYRELLLSAHPELVDPMYWRQRQQDIKEGVIKDIFPYAADLRFTRSF
ncbi:bifunctional isocitrate dehydrogenase kinase/phosphatase [Idiomarina sp. UBA3162]|uniref:bifunctional isocitrate dehydrogenase kinase/phosphatase n=1 Tax=unclassified Idiomarina TaxID=2614829 RepID=UPI000C890588|nr:bifunctional isocitrate dehydrogenase kinase/phosphatase [Idiomarina sp. UBA3162]MAD54144.1 bifunctional isocitrate dehydrogenase kinase/phosphatase [Idiomarinaceae bacterium]MEC9319790.1 bifunctional isocitrate dehydrogenase kinase/phosphatase [Pseudomonadota bacterium]|tara:strand:- start:1986 stop:3686 length:1701 start_codon:yes stop_codon:yes gene_type:complete